jgi:hypothetical protein
VIGSGTCDRVEIHGRHHAKIVAGWHDRIETRASFSTTS